MNTGKGPNSCSNYKLHLRTFVTLTVIEKINLCAHTRTHTHTQTCTHTHTHIHYIKWLGTPHHIDVLTPTTHLCLPTRLFDKIICLCDAVFYCRHCWPALVTPTHTHTHQHTHD